MLSKYDLHLFPTRFYAEGFPGTLIDFFIAGVPTLSSTFVNSADILSEDDSFFFEINNKEDLISKLLYIYSNQNELLTKRAKTKDKRKDCSIEKFNLFLEKTLEL